MIFPIEVEIPDNAIVEGYVTVVEFIDPADHSTGTHFVIQKADGMRMTSTVGLLEAAAHETQHRMYPGRG